MKVLIVGPITIPQKIERKKYFSEKDFVYENNFHTHPWIYNLAFSLRKVGHEVHYCTVTGFVARNRHFAFEEINYNYISSYKLFGFITFHLFDIIKLFIIIKNTSPDIIHCQGNGFYTISCKLSKVPFVITNHGNLRKHLKALFNKKITLKFIRRTIFLLQEIIFEKISYIIVKNVIAVSNDVMQDSKKYYRTNNIVLINNSIGYEYFNIASTTFTNRKNDIVFIGTITNLKQVHIIVEALINTSANLKIISQFNFNDDYFKNLQRYISTQNLKDRVNFLGSKNSEQIINVLLSSKILILPSLYESFGMVLCEAMALGLPVIGTRVGGIVDIIDEGKTGFLITPGDSAELSKKINLLLEDSELWLLISSNAKKEAILRWHPAIIAEATVIFYKKILERAYH